MSNLALDLDFKFLWIWIQIQFSKQVAQFHEWGIQFYNNFFLPWETESREKYTFGAAPLKVELRDVDRLKVHPSAWISGLSQVEIQHSEDIG